MPHPQGPSGCWPQHGLIRGLVNIGLGGQLPSGPGAFSHDRGAATRAAILRVLAEQPMHGYQIIQELSLRSGGAWSPTAGSVYPMLQLLADEGLVTSTDTDGRKVFALTDSGRAAAADVVDAQEPLEATTAGGVLNGLRDLKSATGSLLAAVVLVGKSGEATKVEATVEILKAARKQVHKLLAED